MYKIVLNRSVIDSFRDTVNESPWFLYNDADDKKNWNILCACMDRITDIVDYLNKKELGDSEYRSNAFDFIDFIGEAAVLIDSVYYLGRIVVNKKFDVRIDIPHEEFFKSKKVVNESNLNKSTEYYDKRYFEYIRSICAMHPTLTNRHKDFQTCDYGEVSPFILWSKITHSLRDDGAELHIHIYDNGEVQRMNALPIYLQEVFGYISWIYSTLDYLSSKLKEKYDKKISSFKTSKLPSLNECVDYKDYLSRLYFESEKRFSNTGYLFETAGYVSGLKMTRTTNAPKYKHFEIKLKKAVEDARNKLQAMDSDSINSEELPLERLLYPEVDEKRIFAGSYYFYSKTMDFVSKYGDIERARWATEGLLPFLSKYVDITRDDCETLNRYELYALICIAFDQFYQKITP